MCLLRSENMQNNKVDLVNGQNGSDSKSLTHDASSQKNDESFELGDYWLEYAKTQNIISELLQFELDSLSEVVEQKVKNIQGCFSTH